MQRPPPYATVHNTTCSKDHQHDPLAVSWLSDGLQLGSVGTGPPPIGPPHCWGRRLTAGMPGRPSPRTCPETPLGSLGIKICFLTLTFVPYVFDAGLILDSCCCVHVRSVVCVCMYVCVCVSYLECIIASGGFVLLQYMGIACTIAFRLLHCWHRFSTLRVLNHLTTTP